jgi:signal transduction histidine kinase
MQAEKQIHSSRFDAAATLETRSGAATIDMPNMPIDTPTLQTTAHNNPDQQSNPQEAVCREAEGLRVLLVTGIEGAENCAHAMTALLGNGAGVEVAANRRMALAALRKKDYSVLVVEESLAECDPSGAEQLWRSAGGAMPIQVNFALAGTNRIAREIRAAASRREREQERARKTAIAAMEQDLRSTVAGLLLHSELALASSKETPQVAERLRTVVDLAGSLRQQLGGV